jgi:hypothetical protein
MPAADLNALDAALADFDLEGDAIEEIIGDEEVNLEAGAEILDDDALADLDIALDRTASYEAQPAGKTLGDVETPAPVKPAKAAKEKKAKAPKEPKEAKEPRVPRDINSVKDEFFILSGDPATMDDADKAVAKASTMAKMPTQKKIAEKFENFFTAISVGAEPSRYTMIAFRVLDEKKDITATDITGAYKAAGLGDGTARSQQTQLMNLLPALGIADRVGQSLKLRSDSLLAERLRKLPTAAA